MEWLPVARFDVGQQPPGVDILINVNNQTEVLPALHRVFQRCGDSFVCKDFVVDAEGNSDPAQPGEHVQILDEASLFELY